MNALLRWLVTRGWWMRKASDWIAGGLLVLGVADQHQSAVIAAVVLKSLEMFASWCSRPATKKPDWLRNALTPGDRTQ